MPGTVSLSASSALLLWLVGWLATGVLVSLVMGRRGHDPFGWLLLGAILGPLALPVAISAAGEPGRLRPTTLEGQRHAATG